MAGKENNVGVELGTSIVEGNVGYGNGLIEESGLMKMINTTIKTMSVAASTAMDKISQILSFKPELHFDI